MSHVSFEVTAEEDELIEKIAVRADKEIFKPNGIAQSIMDTEMDLAACIAQGCPLRLQEMLDDQTGSFGHDVAGIRRHINRQTGKLEGHFLPRFHAT